MEQDNLIEEGFSLLSGDSENKLSKLADIIAKNILLGDENKVYYFTLPIWDYEINKWQPSTIGRFWNGKHWEDELVKGGAYQKYDNFFSEAKKDFSFIEFFTKDVAELPSLFTINYQGNCFSLEGNTLNLRDSLDTTDVSAKEVFVEAAMPLIGNNNSDRKSILGKLYDFLCKYKNDYEDIEYIYLFPSLLFRGKEDKRLISSGGVILVCREMIDSTKLKHIAILSNLCYRELGGKNWAKKSHSEANKSAKSAIMSRNMSHNLGSHVMSYLKQHLGTVKDVINGHVLSELIKGETDLKTVLNEDVDTLALPFLLGLGHFISYLQERQDFIATIATDYIPYYSTVNFKDDIYDVLNPDKRVERHPERDKTSNMKMDNILLGNIARSEGLGRTTCPTDKEHQGNNERLGDIVLCYKDFDGDPVVSGSDAEKDLYEMRGFNFSLPGGIVGRQAVFSILENIIRNAAKHGNWHISGNLQLYFKIYSIDNLDKIPDDDFADGCLSLRDVINRYYVNSDDIDDLFFVTVTDNCETDLDKLAKLRIALQDDFIDETGAMRDGYKGLKEMRISSAWIRSLRDEIICYNPVPKYNERDSEENRIRQIEAIKHDAQWIALSKNIKKKAPLLYTRISAIRIDDNVENMNLQYIFCIPIPRKVAVITDVLFDENIKTRLRKKYWHVYTKQSFLEEKNKSFEFILCDDKDDSQLYTEIRPIASSRVANISQIKDINRDSFFCVLKNEELDSEEFEKNLDDYEKILYRHLSSYIEGDQIRIEDDRAKSNVCKEEETSLDVITRGNILLSGTPHPGKYIYRTHHEAFDLFEKYMKSSHSDTEFVEGISGNNSTDRLVRNEEKNEIWFCRHLHAIKQQVAVFDERIYSRLGLKIAKEYSKDHIATTFIQKGVFAFTLAEDKNNRNSFGLYGVTMKNGMSELGNKYECLCDKLATISYSAKDGLNMESTPEGDYILQKFDFITIHQGLLDKLYESFGIKNISDKNKANEEKIRITNQLYMLLSKYGKKIEEKERVKQYKSGIVKPWTDGFVPCMMIHSGRSKPGVNDMPQKLPFLQYAAIEHAVLDCKYSLVELLDYARYEM